jgi:hypothetical protein
MNEIMQIQAYITKARVAQRLLTNKK